MAPPVDVFDQTARLQQVEFVLEQLAPVCRPLVVQALYLLRDEFGLAAPENPDPTALIAWADRVPAHVRARPTIAGQPPTMTGVDLSSAGLCEWLRATVPQSQRLEHGRLGIAGDSGFRSKSLR